MDFKVDAFEKTINEQLKPAVQKAVEDTIIDLGVTAEARAKYYCPVDTGRLRSSIVFNYSGSGKTATAMFSQTAKGGTNSSQETTSLAEPDGDESNHRLVLGTNVEYAFWVEQWCSFLYQGTQEALARLENILRRNFKNIKFSAVLARKV